MASQAISIAIKAIDQLTSPFKAMRKQTEELGSAFRESQSKIREMAATRKMIESFAATKDKLASYKLETESLTKSIDDLNLEMTNATRPTKSLQKELAKLQQKQKLVISATDLSQAELDKLETNLHQAGYSTNKLTSATIKLDQALERERQAARAAKDALAPLNKAHREIAAIKEKTQAMGTIATNVTVGGVTSKGIGEKLIGAVAKPVNVAVEFEQRMSTIQALAAGDEGDKAKREAIVAGLRDQALELGASTQYSASQAADAQAELSRSGWTVNQILGGTPSVLLMAKAANLELAQAAEIASGTMNGFGLMSENTAEQLKQVMRVSDVLALAANKSSQGVADIGEAFKYVAPVAKAAGIELETISAATMAAANAQIKGSAAGTALRAGILRLAAPTKESTKLMESLGMSAEEAAAGHQAAMDATRSLGIQVTDSAGNMKPFQDIMEQMAIATKDMGDAKRLDVVSTIFGTEASATFLAIMDKALDKSGKGLRGFEAMLRQSAGTSQRLKAIMEDNAGGAIANLGSAVEGLSIAVGSLLLNDLKDVIAGIAGAVGSIINWVNNNKTLAKTILIAGAVIGGLAVTMGTAMIVAGALINAFTTISGVVSIATIRFGVWKTAMMASSGVVPGLIAKLAALKIAIMTHPILFIAGLVAIVAGLIIYHWDKIGPALVSVFNFAWKWIKTGICAIVPPIIEVAGSILYWLTWPQRKIIEAYLAVGSWFLEFLKGMGGPFEAFAGWIEDVCNSLVKTITGIIPMELIQSVKEWFSEDEGKAVTVETTNSVKTKLEPSADQPTLLQSMGIDATKSTASEAEVRVTPATNAGGEPVSGRSNDIRIDIGSVSFDAKLVNEAEWKDFIEKRLREFAEMVGQRTRARAYD